MQIKPILSALRRHKAGTFLIAMQIALTLAIVCNALFIIHQRVAHLSEPTGIDEANIFIVKNEWVGAPDSARVDAMMRADLQTLRQVPGVQDATPSNSYPLRGSGWDDGVKLKPDQLQDSSGSTIYFADEHFIDTLGLKLIAGRNFRADEIGHMDMRYKLAPPVVIITRALADKLFPGGQAVGKTIYLIGGPATVVGVVDLLQAQSVERWASDFAYRSVIIPERLTLSLGSFYIVRARPGQLDAAMRAAGKALFAQNPRRVIADDDGLLSFSEVRSRAYESDRGMAILMGVISIVLLAVTAAGIVGLTSFWVGQRRRQIGVRRALGATRQDILHYFMTENLLISCAGVLVGTVLAIAMNLWMVTRFEMHRLSLSYLVTGVVILLLLGQGAVLAPALRASRVPPVEATRSV
ncbi:putative ABC transport system permease protein [Dyella jiangningensis]|uniref:ABC transporter permease n=1 Tax=Dyella sp. AtDHG13 TaxID=1938897 RepID=UPI0008900F0B|nr:ABC transporter permease [Dyella sp. AtDHG13]PXV58129.1 putative ABC transport system permease protein [Dyella sp. AtDHG13]SDK14625.1 putative ABC transport system permease protein [Dyella jiangningensis]